MTFNIQSVLTGFVYRRDPGDNATETRNTVQWTDYGGRGVSSGQFKVAGGGGGVRNCLEIKPVINASFENVDGKKFSMLKNQY